MRLVAAAPFLALAVFFGVVAWNPLGNGYFRAYKDSPDGLYLTIAGIGASLAALFAATGLVITSRWFRRHGGLFLMAAFAALAAILPYVLFKWTTESDPWAWAFFIQDSIAWLRLEPRARWYGIAIEVALAVVAVGAVTAQVVLWAMRPARPRPRGA